MASIEWKRDGATYTGIEVEQGEPLCCGERTIRCKTKVETCQSWANPCSQARRRERKVAPLQHPASSLLHRQVPISQSCSILPPSPSNQCFLFQPADNGAIYTCLGHHPTLDAPLKVLRYIHCNAMHCVQHHDESR